MELEENGDNAPNEGDDLQSFVESELEALKSIYINEIDVKQDDDQKSTCVSIELHPATADKPEEQYVRMTLKFILCEEYPQIIPEISIRNPRGLSDEKLSSIHQELISIAEDKIGNSMLFEIIEAAKEHLTTGNRPCGECAICLYGFSEEDVFTKTDCYHYFHSHCLARYAKNAITAEKEDVESSDDAATISNELLCPMCREPIQFDGSEELYPPPSAGDESYSINERILEIQKRMADLYQKQLEKGGIIDIEAEKNKFLLEISNVPTRVNITEEDDSIDAINSKEENSVSQSMQKEHHNKEVQNESKNAPTKFKERTKSEKYGKKFDKSANQKSRSDNYRFSKKCDKHYEQSIEHCENETGDRSEAPEEMDNELTQGRDMQSNLDGSPNPRPAKQSPFRKDRQRYNNYSRPKRNNYDDYNRDNHFRNSYPPNRSRGRGYSQNSYQRHNYKDWSDQGYRRYDSGRSNNVQNDSNSRPDDTSFDDAKVSHDNKNVSDSYRKNNSYNRGPYRGRGRFQGKRHSDNFYRDRDSNYPRKGYPKQQSDRNTYRYSEEFGSYKGKGSQFKNDHHGKYDKDPNSDIEASRIESESQSPTVGNENADENFSENFPPQDDWRYFEKDDGASFSGGNSLKDDNVQEVIKTEEDDYGTPSHKSQTTDNHTFPSYDEGKVNARKEPNYRDSNFSRNSNRYDRGDSRRQVEGNYSKDRNDYDRHPVRDKKQYPNRKSYDSAESSSHFERNEHFSQESASRRNPQRNSYGGNQYNQGNYRDKGRGRGNSHFQNRNSNYESNQRKFRYNNENPGFRGDRDSQKLKDSTKNNCSEDTNASTQNGKLSDNFQQADPKVSSSDSVPEISKSKNLNVNVKPFVPKEDLGALSSDQVSGKDENIIDPELNSPIMPSPPPGFSNPLKKVVYGLKAANPPPGFPRR